MMLMDVNDFAFRPTVRRWIERDEPQVFAHRDLDQLYKAVESYIDVPPNANIASTLAGMNLKPTQAEGGWWRLVFDKDFA